jgi:hypothetical protein
LFISDDAAKKREKALLLTGVSKSVTHTVFCYTKIIHALSLYENFNLPSSK